MVSIYIYIYIWSPLYIYIMLSNHEVIPQTTITRLRRHLTFGYWTLREGHLHGNPWSASFGGLQGGFFGGLEMLNMGEVHPGIPLSPV